MLTKIVLFLTALILVVILFAIGTAIYHKVNHDCQNLFITSGTPAYSKC